METLKKAAENLRSMDLSTVSVLEVALRFLTWDSASEEVFQLHVSTTVPRLHRICAQVKTELSVFSAILVAIYATLFARRFGLMG